MNLREIRKSRGLTMKQLGDMVGVTESAIGLWETGKREPKNEMLLKLGEALDCSVLDIIGADNIVRLHSESPLETKYKALDKHGKKVVDFVLDAEYQRCTKKELVDVPKTRVVPLFRAAAGPGEQVDGTPFEEYEVLSPVPGEFAVKISGDSMEPELHDGEVVMCAKKVPDPGEIGVIMVNGFLLVKQVQADNNGIYLRSLNRDRADLDVDLPYESNDTVTSYGTVIHKKLPFVK